METIVELLKIIMPAGIVLYGAYLLVRSFLQKQVDEISLSLTQKNQNTVLPIRLQAYERVILLLERTSPNQLLTRVGAANYTVEEFQQILIHEIRNEFNHNLSQQLYMSSSGWVYVSTAIEHTISLINTKASALDPKAKAFELAKSVLQVEESGEPTPQQQAKEFVKAEIQKLF